MNLRALGLDSERLATLQSLLAETPALNDLLNAHEETAIERALRFLSLVRLFNEPLYSEVFRAHDPGLPPFEDVVRHPHVAPVPRTDEKYWLREDAQLLWQAEWEYRRDDERLWCQRLYGWMTVHGGTVGELLDLLLRYDTIAALSLLRREYDLADGANDMVLCHAITEAVEASMDRIPEDRKDPFLHFVTRYRARALFLTELHLTTKYYPRPALEEAFDNLVRGDGAKWILFLDAPGGMGKTTFERRIIAHKLLKNPPFPLVARVDLDDLNVSSLAAAPWLIAIEIARGLDLQLPRKLFSGPQSFLDQVEVFRPLLYRRTSDRAPALSDNEMEQLRSRARDEFYQWSKFQSYVLELPRDRPLIIFIDTIEEASLHFADKFRKVLDNFQELRASLSQLRLVLSGRHRPDTSHFREYDEALKRQTAFETLNPLEHNESEAFIEEILRPQRLAGELLGAMIKSGEGNPFKLELLCEIVADRPSMSASELQNYPGADVAYLIQRVISRIPIDTELGLRWLLRYGAVPRRLTFSFLTTTLHPLLIRALSGELEAANEDIPSSDVERNAWLKRADVDLDPLNLWGKLTKYSSEHGWISVDPKDSNTITLHSEVVKPMRRLLKEQRAEGRNIYTTLSAEAARHFGGLKREHPERWVDFVLGQLFHLIESETADPLQSTRDAFGERPSPADATLRIELAREIVKADGDFSDAPPAVRAWANYEAADAIAIHGNFRYLPADDRRQELSRHLAQACDLARDTRVQLPAIIWRWREFLDSNYPDTRSAVIGLFGLRSEDRSRYWLLLVDLFGMERLGRRTASLLRVLITGFDWLIDSARIPKWIWKERYAASLIQLGCYKEAASSLRETLKAASLPHDIDRIRSRRIKALVRSLELAQAETELERFPKDEALADEKLVFRAEIHLLRHNAWAALECAGRFQNPSDYRAHLIRGMAFGQLLRVADASAAFSEALTTTTALGQQFNSDRVQLEQLRFRLLEADLPAETTPARRVDTISAAALVQTEFELCRAWQLRSKNPTAAAACILALTSETFGTLIRARAMLAAFSWNMLPETSLGAMLTVLESIDSDNARLYLTAPPVEFRDKLQVGTSGLTGVRLRNLLGPNFDHSGVNLAYLYCARFLRAMGRDGKAESMFQRYKLSSPPTREELTVLRQFRKGERVVDPPEMWAALREEPSLYFAAMVENAERALVEGETETAKASLELVTRTPEVERLLPSFASRHVALETSLALPGAMSTLSDAAPETPLPDSYPHGLRCLLLGTEGDRLSTLRFGQIQPELISTVESRPLTVLTAYSRERTPRRFVELLVRDWEQTLEDLAGPFEESGLLQPGDSPPEPVFLALTTTQLVAAPWELALSGSRSWLVRIGPGRVEGMVPEAFRTQPDPGALADLISKAAKPFTKRPSVTVFSPFSDAGEVANRIGGTVTPTITRSDIIYILSPMYPDSRGGEPSLAPGLTADSLCNQIASQPGSQRPFVILYTPAVDSLSHAVEQLLFRNQFAQALVNSGGVSGVLATGLDDPARLLGAVLGARTLFEIPGGLFTELPRAQTDQPLRLLALFGSALFLAIGPPVAV